MTRYLESAAARNQEDAVARVLESGGAAGGAITESWTGADGTAWPSPPWTVTKPTGGTITNTIQGNRGQLSASAGAYTMALAQLGGSTHTDLDVTFTYNALAVVEHYIDNFYRLGALSGGFPASCYCLDLDVLANTVNLQVIDANGSATSYVATVNSAGINVATDLNVRIYVIGNRHRVRWWTGTEPSTWQIDANDSTYTSGTFALGLYSGGSTALVGVQYDNLSLTALTPTTPSTLWKGVGAIREAAMASDLTLPNVSWYYDWANYSPTIGLIDVPATSGIEYVPMMWGDWQRTYPGFDIGGAPAASLGPSDTLLGFNEPDVPAQADMTVARALALWPALEATGARLGSPAPGGGTPNNPLGWLSSFMSGNGGPAPRVDFMCVHWYPEYDSGYSSLAAFLDYIHTTYSRPVWLTEVGSLGGSYTDNAALMPSVMDICNARPWVERVAWFVLNDTNAGYVGSGLVASGSLTASGTVYATYPERPTALSIAFAGAAAGSSSTTGALSVARRLVGTISGLASTTTGAVAVARALASTNANGTSTTTGALAVARALAGTATGVSTDSGVMIVARALAGTATGLSTTTGDLAGSSAKTLDGSAAGLSTTTGALSIARGLSASAAASSTTTGALIAQRTLAGTAGGLSTTTGALARAVPLAGTADGVSTASATTLSTAGLFGGSSNGEGTATGTLAVARALTGSATGASTVTGAVARAVPVAGTAAGLSTTTGALPVARTLVGSASGVSTAGGTALTVARALVGSADGVSTTTASLLATAAGGLAGFTAGSSTTTGSLSVARPLAGTSGGLSSPTGAISKAIPLASVSAVGVGATTGVIARAVALTATAGGTSATAAATAVARRLAGSSDGLSTADVNLILARRLAGSSSGASDATGTLQAIRIETIFGFWNGQTFQAMQYGDQQVVDFLIIPS